MPVFNLRSSFMMKINQADSKYRRVPSFSSHCEPQLTHLEIIDYRESKGRIPIERVTQQYLFIYFSQHSSTPMLLRAEADCYMKY